MKKAIKTIAAIVIIAIMFSCAFTMSASAEAERGTFYSKLAVVVEIKQISTDLLVISCEDRTGNLWAFYDDIGEWTIGDITNLLMWNMGECEEDDEIIEVYWEGYTENIEEFFHVTK